MKNFFKTVFTAKVWFLISAAAFVSSILIVILEQVLHANFKTSFGVYLLIIWFLSLYTGAILAITKSSPIKNKLKHGAILAGIVLIMMISILSSSDLKEILFIWIMISLCIFFITLVVIESLYQLLKQVTPKIVKMDTKDILTIIVVPIVTFLLGRIL